MHFISVKQPWAHLLVNGCKRVENRDNALPKVAAFNWIGIHAIKTKDDMDDGTIEHVRRKLDMIGSVMLWKCKLSSEKGHLVGAVMFGPVNPDTAAKTPFLNYPRTSRFHWYIIDFVAFDKPVKLKGGQGLQLIKDKQIQIQMLHLIDSHVKSRLRV